LIDILENAEKPITQMTLKAYYVKDDQKTIHKLEAPMIVPYKYRKNAEILINETTSSTSKNKNISAQIYENNTTSNETDETNSNVEFKEASYTLDDGFVAYSLGGISLLFVVSQLLKLVLI